MQLPALERTIAPVSSHTAFTGSVPANYDRYLGPALFEPYAAELTGRVPWRDDLRVLELACGTGALTRRLREAMPASATLVATDLNEPMVDYARSAVGTGGIAWQQADAQQLPFGDDSFDVVACQFGLMFLPDKVQGLREARRVLSPGGVFIASVWQSIDDSSYTRQMQTALEALFPDAPPRFLDVPYGYNDPLTIHADLESAGWRDARVEPVRLQSTSPSALEFATGFAKGSPLTHELIERGADLDAVAAAIAEQLSPGGETPFALELAAIVITAVRD